MDDKVTYRMVPLPRDDVAYGARVAKLVEDLNSGDLTEHGFLDLLRADYPKAEFRPAFGGGSPHSELWYIYRDGAEGNDPRG